jgi:adenosylmethionine-8-amino-7-oxononanoate aminotransferase
VGARVCLDARASGLLVRPLGDVIVIMPPLSISVDELDWMMDVLERSMEKILAESSP